MEVTLKQALTLLLLTICSVLSTGCKESGGGGGGADGAPSAPSSTTTTSTTTSSSTTSTSTTTSSTTSSTTSTSTTTTTTSTTTTTTVVVWAGSKTIGGVSKNTEAWGTASDASGNLIIAGQTDAALDGNTLSGTTDMFVAKFDSAGNKQWTKQLGAATKATYGTNVGTDASGNIYVVGITEGGLDGNAKVSPNGSYDFFLTKYSSAGARLWTKQLGSAVGTVNAKGIAIDSSSNVFVGGYVNGGIDGNAAIGAFDAFITKYDSAGNKDWTRTVGVASKQANGQYVAVDSLGNSYIVGRTTGGLDGNTLKGIMNDAFVTKFNSAGTKQWTQQLGVISHDTAGDGVVTDSANNVYITGVTVGDLDGITLTGTHDSFITKYDSNGTKQWTRLLGVASKQTKGYSLARDASDNVYVVGYTTGGLDGNSLTGLSDFFVAKYNSSGTKQWTRQLGAAGASTLQYGAATDSSSSLYVCGTTSGNLDGNTRIGTQDGFVTKFSSAGVKQ